MPTLLSQDFTLKDGAMIFVAFFALIWVLISLVYVGTMVYILVKGVILGIRDGWRSRT